MVTDIDTDPVRRAAWLDEVIAEAKRDLAEAETEGTEDSALRAARIRSNIARFEADRARELERLGS